MKKKFISKIGLGTAQFGLDYGVTNLDGITPESQVQEIINFSRENNIKLIDTSINYGKSELVLGKANINSFDVITKVPRIANSKSYYHDYSSLLGQSIQKLQINSLSGVLFHDANDLLSKDGMDKFNAMKELKAEGLVDRIGVSVYDVASTYDIINNFEIDIVQGPLNIFDRRFLTSGLLKDLKKSSIEFHARSIFLQGILLSNSYKTINYFRKWSKLFLKFDEKVNNSCLTPLAICLAFVFEIEDIDNVIVGVQDLNQLKEILHSLGKEICLDDFDDIYSNDIDLVNPGKWRLS